MKLFPLTNRHRFMKRLRQFDYFNLFLLVFAVDGTIGVAWIGIYAVNIVVRLIER